MLNMWVPTEDNLSLSSHRTQNDLAQDGFALNVKTEVEEENTEANLSPMGH